MKILLSFLILFLVFAPFLTFAQTEVVYPSLPGVVAPQDIVREAQTEKEILPLFIDYIFRLILVISLIAVIGVILYAGTLYLLSTGNPIKTKIAREWILSAIQGTLVIFSSYALLYALDSQLVLFGLRNLEKGDRVERVDLNWEIRNSYFQIPFGLLIEDAILNENAKNKLYDVLDATNEAEAVAEAIYQGSKQLLAIIESCPVGMLCGGGGPANNPGNIPYSPPPSSQRLTNASIPPTSPQAQIFATNNQPPTTTNPSSTTGPPSPSSNENSSFGEDETGGIGDPSVVSPAKVIRRGDDYSITASDAFIVSNEKNRMPPDYLLDLFAFPDYEERQAELDEIEETIETLRQDSWMRGLLEEQKDLFAEKTELFRQDRINHILDVKDVIQEQEPGNIPFGSKVQEKLNAADYLLLQEGYFADLYNNPDLTFSEKNNIAKDILNVVDRIGLGSKNPTNYGFEGPVTVYDIKDVERWWYPALTDAAGNIVKDENGYTVYSEEASYALVRDVHIARGVWGTPENLTDDNGVFIQKIFEELGFVSLPILDETHVTSNQGWRKYTGNHAGTDFIVDNYITKIIAVSDQYVAETHVGGGGGVTLVSHIPLNKNTYIKTISSHLSGTEVAPGMTVSAGTIIGTGGNTGHSTGPHLHWEAHLVVTDDDGNIISDDVIRNDALFSPESIKSVGGSVTNKDAPFMEREELESILFPSPLFPPPDTQNKNDYFLNYYTSIMSPFSSLFGIQLVFASDKAETIVRRFLSADGGGKSSPGTKSPADLNEEGLTAFHGGYDYLKGFAGLHGGSDDWMRGVYPSYGPPKKQEHSEEPGEITKESLEEEVLQEEEIPQEEEEKEIPQEEEEIPQEEEEEEEEEEIPQEEEEEETPSSMLCCPPCPNIAPLVQAKIAEIESYFPIFMEKFEALLQTKEPIKEDLFQLYKAMMIKSLGAQYLINYNSLLFARRYYEKEEIVIRTAEEKTEIGEYYWDWTQWLNNTLYRIKFDEKIIEENDPATFYLRDPLAKKIVSDATRMALSAKEEGIQDAGSLIGIPRKMPPPPPDYGNKLYLPTNPEKTRITSPFGWRYDPFTRERVMHHGLDLAGPRYSPIYAAEAGEVVFAGWMGTKTTGYGKLIIIYHKASEIDGLNSDLVTYYGHLEPNSFMVKRGDVVTRGQHIAGMGTTGRSTGYHLHYEVREDVRYPYVIHTGTQVDPASYIDIDYYAFNVPSFTVKSSVFASILQKMCPQEASAKTDMDVLFEYLNENNIKVESLTEERLIEILDLLGITSDVTPLLVNPDAQPASDLLVCGMEIPVGETFELTWDHLVELLDTIDYYISEGERLIQQQQLMNELSRPCSCPCAGDCCECIPPYCGGCTLTCDLGAIRAAHNDVAKTRQKLREIAAHIKLLTDGHFNTPTEELCDDLNEDIRDDEELVLCSNGGSKLLTKHELITRKLNFSRYSFDECITRPEHLEEVLEGTRAGKLPFFGPVAEENNFKRYTKTIKDDFRINTSDFNWFCCMDSKEQ